MSKINKVKCRMSKINKLKCQLSKINKVNCQMSKIKTVNLDGAYLRSSSGHFLYCNVFVFLRLFACHNYTGQHIASINALNGRLLDPHNRTGYHLDTLAIVSPVEFSVHDVQMTNFHYNIRLLLIREAFKKKNTGLFWIFFPKLLLF